jgi:hypothetical protein
VEAKVAEAKVNLFLTVMAMLFLMGLGVYWVSFMLLE